MPTLRDQTRVPTSFVPLRAHSPDLQTQRASRHHVGTSNGFHPEDYPYLTDEHRASNRQPISDDAEDDDALYNTRLPTSARRYAPATTPPPQTVMRVTRHQGPPPKQRAAYTQAPGYQQPEQASAYVQRQRRLHFSVYIGVAMVIMVVGWITLSSLAQWWQVQQDTLHYGMPRTFQVDADVRHGGISHFTVENLHGHILIYEVQLSTLAKAKVYLGPVFSGAGTDLQPATISFADVNGDGYPDLIIAVGTDRYIFINDHTGFRPSTSSDNITGKGV